MSFLDYFSSQSADYALFRPIYPAQLFRWLAGECPNRLLAIDCATGNGQAAMGLAEHFDRVIGIDASGTQLSHVGTHPSVSYVRAVAESCALGEGIADVVTVAQGFHWLAADDFFREAERVLRPGGLLAVWGYGLPRVCAAVDTFLDDHYSETLGTYWSPQRRFVDDEYLSIKFPVAETEFPKFSMTTAISLADLIGYMRSWSATRRFLYEHGSDPLDSRLAELERAWGGAGERQASWPLFGRAGFVDG